MLDGTLKNPFFPRSNTGELLDASVKRASGEQTALIDHLDFFEDHEDEDEEIEEAKARGELELEYVPNQNEQSNHKAQTKSTPDSNSTRKYVEVDYFLFAHTIWPDIKKRRGNSSSCM